MAAKKNKYDAAHLRNLARYSAQVDAIYRSLTKEAAAIASGIDEEMPEDLFSFADYPKTMKRVDALIATYKADMMKVVVNGVKSEWTLANNKNNEIARQVFGDKNGKLTPEQERRYYTNNDTARQAFIDRKERGLNLSDRVWDYSGKFKKEIEMGVDLCLRKGMPAAEMARELQKYLKHPDELFRRVRDEHGMLTLSKAAKDFHPGRGVYRSSYKNALRLAITETNMAYRLADWERWQQMDFVVGIRIQLSNNHTCLGADGEPHPFHDICDELAGDYPKSFKWTGWHPQCRCNAVPILKTVDEKIADNQAKRNGGKASTESVNSVKRMPKAFNEWVERNRDRIAAAKSQPYFIRDNATAVDKIIPGVLPENMVPAMPTIPIAERARMRHDARTPEQIADIRRRWTLREAEIRHAARTPEQAETIRNAWNERKDNTPIIQQPKIPGFNYIADNKNLTFEERAKNIIEGLQALFGTKGNTPDNFGSWWHYIKDEYTNIIEVKRPSMAFDNEIIKPFNKYAKYGFTEQLKAINHWNELAVAKDLAKIPMEWRTLFNGYVQKIESLDIGAVGYTTVYREIEAAYNIYKLSTSPMATKYGLGKISPKMPYQLFDEFKKKMNIDITQTMPKKEFFDSLEEFVPLSTSGAPKETCYFTPLFKFVRIPINLKEVVKRFIESDSYRTRILYHEFGHARDNLSKEVWRETRAWKDLFNKFRDEVNKDNGKAIEAAIKAKYFALRGNDSGVSINDKELLGAYSDTLQSLVNGHRMLGLGGHPIAYWNSNTSLAEFIAHASENYWGGNALFKELYPALYREMCDLVKKMCKQ